MKILVLAQEIGGNAPGVLYERLLSALSSLCELDVAACSYHPSVPVKVRRHYPVSYPRMKHWAMRLMLSLTGRDWLSFAKARSFSQTVEGDYDLVLSLCSNYRFWSLEAGFRLKRERALPWVCFMVDAIPAPVAWNGNGLRRRAVLRRLKKMGPKMDYVASICDEMLAYELPFLHLGKGVRSRAYLPPVPLETVDTSPGAPGNPVFLYAGRIYGKRTARYLLDAFAAFLADSPNARLVFLGLKEDFAPYVALCPPAVAVQIRMEPWTKDVQPWIDGATALIDIDADLPHDVYLSSKMLSYLRQRRPIICETGPDSPSRRIFGGIPSILQCGHNAEELYKAMHRAVDGFGEFDYSDRAAVIREAQEMPQRFYRDLETYVTKGHEKDSSSL